MAFKMKGNPYKMGKMATKSTMKMAKEAMKMKKEAMAKMKKESMAKLKDESMAKLKDESAMKLKTSYKMKEAMAKMKKEEPMKMKKGEPMKQAKPDFPDIDGDGNTKESMKQAAADKKSMAKMKPDMRKTKDIRTKDTRPNPNPAGGKKGTGTGLKPMNKEAMAKMKKGEAMKMKKGEAMKMKKDPAMKLKKESMAKQTKKQKEKLPAGLVKEIAKRYGKSETATAKERVKAEGSKVAGIKK